MLRTLLWLSAGVILGLIIHIVVILTVPLFATQTSWDRIAALGATDGIFVLPEVAVGEPNPYGLDPKLVYAVCAFDLSRGPAAISGTLPIDFWSISIVDRRGVSFYSTTNRAGIGKGLDLAIFNKAQSQLLAEQQFEVEQGYLIVQSPADQIYVAVRLAPPHPQMWQRYAEIVRSSLRCASAASVSQGS